MSGLKLMLGRSIELQHMLSERGAKIVHAALAGEFAKAGVRTELETEAEIFWQAYHFAVRQSWTHVAYDKVTGVVTVLYNVDGIVYTAMFGCTMEGRA